MYISFYIIEDVLHTDTQHWYPITLTLNPPNLQVTLAPLYPANVPHPIHPYTLFPLISTAADGGET